MANFRIINSVDQDHEPNNWFLSFQWGEYQLDEEEGESDYGYRFIWHRPDGSLQAARGQARIPSGAEMFDLIHKAMQAGWFIRCETLPS